MSRVFLQDNQFHQILPNSLSEGEFEQIITLQAPALYPDYHVIPFKKTVYAPDGSGSKPDLVFVARDYKDWYVVEVEMTYHSYRSHVEPQIRTLINADYQEESVTNYICSKCSDLERERLLRLIREEPVKILLILNDFDNEWASDLFNKYGVITSVFHAYRAKTNASKTSTDMPSRAFGISRSYPVYSLATSAQCMVHPYSALLGVIDNSELQLEPDQPVQLEFDNYITFWKVVEGPESSVWLRPEGRDGIIDKSKAYQIKKLRDGSLLLDVQ